MARNTTLTKEIALSLEFYWQLAGDTLSDEQLCQRIGVKFGQLRGWLQRNVKPVDATGTPMKEGLRDIRARAKIQTITGYLSKLHTAADQALAAGDYKAATATWKWLLEKQAPKQYGSRAGQTQDDEKQQQSGVLVIPGGTTTNEWIQQHGEPVPEYLRMRKRAFGEIEQFAQAENRWNIRMLAEAVPVEIALVVPSIATIREMIRSRPVNGRFLSEWFADLEPATLGRVNQQIMLGITQGEGIDQIVRRLVGSRRRQYRDGILQRSRQSVEGFVRTAVAGVSNNVRQETYRHNARVIASIQWVATLDSRTCEACGAQDGKRYAIDDGPRPPLHPTCRCTTAPVLKSWKEMEIDLREAPASVRASMSGLVAQAVTFPDWLKRQPRHVQERVLGKRKTELLAEANDILQALSPKQRKILFGRTIEGRTYREMGRRRRRSGERVRQLHREIERTLQESQILADVVDR